MPRRRRDAHRGSSHVSLDDTHSQISTQNTSGCARPAGKIRKKRKSLAVDTSVHTKNDHEKLSGVRAKIGRPTKPHKQKSDALAFLAMLNREENEKKQQQSSAAAANDNTFQVSMGCLKEAEDEIKNDIVSLRVTKQDCEPKQSPLNDESVRDVFRLCVKYTFKENYQSAESLRKHWRQSLTELLDVQSSSAKKDIDHISCVICKFAPPMSELKTLKPRSAMKRFYEVLEHQVNVEKEAENEDGKELTVSLNKIQRLMNPVASGDPSDEDGI